MQNETLTIHSSILVITKDGKLIRITCPFPVQVIIPVDSLKPGEIHKVVSVRMGEIKHLYMIAEVPYNPSYFVILLNKK